MIVRRALLGAVSIFFVVAWLQTGDVFGCLLAGLLMGVGWTLGALDLLCCE